MAPSDLDGYISTLELADKPKFAAVLGDVGITTLGDLERLDPNDRAELVDAMKEAGCVLGDRSKAKKLITPEHISSWRANPGDSGQKKGGAPAAGATKVMPPSLSPPKLKPVAHGNSAPNTSRRAPPSGEVRYGGVQLRRTPQVEQDEYNPPAPDWRDRRPVSWMPDSERVGVEVTDTQALERARALESLAETEEPPAPKEPIALPTNAISESARAELEAERKAREVAAQNAARKAPINLPKEDISDVRRREMEEERKAREAAASAPAPKKTPVIIPTEEVTAERRAELEAERKSREAKQAAAQQATDSANTSSSAVNAAPKKQAAAQQATDSVNTTVHGAKAAPKKTSPADDAALREARAAAAAAMAEDTEPKPAVEAASNTGASREESSEAAAEVATPAVVDVVPQLTPKPPPEPLFDAKAQREKSLAAYNEALRKADAARQISEANTGKQYFCKQEGGGKFAVQVDEDAEPIEDPRLFTGQGKFEYPDGGWCVPQVAVSSSTVLLTIQSIVGTLGSGQTEKSTVQGCCTREMVLCTGVSLKTTPWTG